MPDAKVVWFEPSASKRWIVAFGSGSTPILPDEPTPTNSAPVFGSIARWRFWWPCTMPNTPFLVIISSPTTPGTGLRCSGGTSSARLLGRAGAGTQRAEPMRHLPDAVLVGDQHVVVPPGEAVGPVEVLDVALDPLGLAVAVLVAQQGEIAGALLGHQHVAVRQHQQAARMLQPGGEGVAVKPSGTRGVWPLYGTISERLVTIGPVFGGGRSSALTVKRRPISWSGSDAGLSGAAFLGRRCARNSHRRMQRRDGGRRGGGPQKERLGCVIALSVAFPRRG